MALREFARDITVRTRRAMLLDSGQMEDELRMYLYPYEYEPIVAVHNLSVQGSGRDHLVVVDPLNPDQLVAVRFLPPDTAETKRQFWINKLACQLFPHNIATLKKCETRMVDGTKVSYSIREYVPGVPLAQPTEFGQHVKDTEAALSEKGFTFVHPFSDVLAIIEKYKLPLVVDTDARNYIATLEGEIVYIDQVQLKYPFSEEAFTRYADNQKLSRTKIDSIIKRLQDY